MSNRKFFKNERQRGALEKRQETMEYGQPDPPKRDLELQKAEFVSRKQQQANIKLSKPTWNKKPPSPQTVRAKPTPFDDSKQNIKPLPEGEPVRVFRVEVESFNSSYPHAHVPEDGSQVSLYTPNKPTDIDSWRDKDTGQWLKGKKTPKKDDPNFNEKFLESRKGLPSGNRTFVNFGEPSRALEFFDQKSNNPTEIQRGNKFQIKSFEVPHDVFKTVSEKSVHESQGKHHPDDPMNVDRKAPNQFGLPQAHTSLLEARQIKDTARIEKPEDLRKDFKPVEHEKQRPQKKVRAPNAHWASKGADSYALKQEIQEAHEMLHPVDNYAKNLKKFNQTTNTNPQRERSGSLPPLNLAEPPTTRPRAKSTSK